MRYAFNEEDDLTTTVKQIFIVETIKKVLITLNSHPNTLLLLLLLQLIVTEADTLTCMTCANNPDETTELHKFRISTGNMQPTCVMEPIQCDPDQDACVKIVMHMGNGHFWIGSGCDYQKNFNHVSCKTEPVYTRSIQDRQVFERRTPQRTCVCLLSLCNVSSKTNAQFLSHFSLLLLYLLYFYNF